jgi:hypothetical protein
MSDAPQADDESLPDPEALLAAYQRASRRRLRLGLAALAAFCAFTVLFSTLGERVAAFSRGELDWRGRRRFEPAHPIDPDAVAAIDMRRVHERLLPAWVIAEAHSATPEGQRLALRAYARLRAELAPDANLTALLDSLHESLIEADLLGERTRIDWLVWAYDEYLDRAHVPYRIEAGLRDSRRGVLFWSRSYRVVADVTSRAGSAPARTRLLARVDATNVLDPYVGHSSLHEDGAIVVLDRVLHFSVLEVWPLLDPSNDAALRERARSFAPSVRAEAERGLPLAERALLRSTAVDVGRLVRTIGAMHARRACGSRFVMRELPWNGLSPVSREVLERALVRGVGSGCPDATLGEARSISEVSERLRRTAGLAAAVEGLVSWVARSVALHELVHVAEVDHGERHEPTCASCPPEMREVERDELRAYLASFADERAGAVALLQACDLAGHPLSANGQAFAYAAQRLLGTRGVRACDLGPPANLHARADREARALFGALPQVDPALPPRVEFLARR